MKPRVLLSTPCRDSLSTHYVNGLFDWMANYQHEAEIIPSLGKSPYVNIARNDAVEVAREKKCGKVVFIDSDVGWRGQHLSRLLSHDVPIVGGSYAKRIPGKVEWAHHVSPDAKPNENGLMPANDLPAGFLSVDMEVFDAIRDVFKGRTYQHGDQAPRCEYFPISLTVKGGCQHPSEMALNDILDRFEHGHEPWLSKQEIFAIIARNRHAELPGEDVGFCKLAQAVGFTTYLDISLILPHYGEIAFPAQTITL